MRESTHKSLDYLFLAIGFGGRHEVFVNLRFLRRKPLFLAWVRWLESRLLRRRGSNDGSNRISAYLGD